MLLAQPSLLLSCPERVPAIRASMVPAAPWMPGSGLARISHRGHGLRGAVAPRGQERPAARCRASGKGLDAACRNDSTAPRVGSRRPPAVTSWASKASSVAGLRFSAFSWRGGSPGTDADRDHGEKCGRGLFCLDPSGSSHTPPPPRWGRIQAGVAADRPLKPSRYRLVASRYPTPARTRPSPTRGEGLECPPSAPSS